MPPAIASPHAGPAGALSDRPPGLPATRGPDLLPGIPSGRPTRLRLPWTHHSSRPDAAAVFEAMEVLGDALGRRSGGRSGAEMEIVVPKDASQAHPRSLSAMHGLDELPLHVEHSHRTRPSRYLLLGCIDPGGPGAATTLLDREDLCLTEDECALLRSAPLLVRSGRRPFYSTVLPTDGGFMRYDRACMEAVCDRGRVALELVGRKIARCRPERHEWRAGDILVIDNWRALHGRAPAEATTDRRLARMTING